MAQTRDVHQAEVFQARHQIFNRLCLEYRRSREDPAFNVRAEVIRRELALPESVFTRALDGFVDAAGEKIIEVFVRDGERYLRLGDSAKFNLSDWAEIPHNK